MARIWKQELTKEVFSKIYLETMIYHLDVEFVEAGDDFLTLRMPVDARVKQPFGIMHGGASCVLAETAGSIGGQFCLDSNTHYCVGTEINTSHIKSIREGWVLATAKPLHLGQTTQLWEIPIIDNRDRLISVSRLRLAVLARK